jgi:hypothetical protein
MIRTRLLDIGIPPQRGLLYAGAEEEPSPAARRSAARLLGLAPETAALTAAIHLWLRILRRTSSAAPAVAPAIVAAAIVAGAYMIAHRSSVPLQLRHGTPTLPAAASAPSASGLPAPVAGEAVPVVLSTSSVPLPGARHRALDRASPFASVRDVAFGRQVVMLDHARSIASSGNIAGVLHILDDYDRQFPNGILSEEATLIRIQALLARGEQTTAAALASRFLKVNPRSVHADRIHRLIEGGGK